jgi:dTDP-4-dehydrorhamnose reductase
VLVTGASGNLGWALSERLASTSEVIASYNAHASVPEGSQGVRLDLSDKGSIRDLLHQYRPEVIFHAAAMTGPDECERDPRKTTGVNLEATAEIAEMAKSLGARLVFVSTDLVFDGKAGNYSEEDVPKPLSVYGTTKLKAEQAVLGTCPDGAVIRTSLLYGRGTETSGNFLSSLYCNLAAGNQMRLFSDQKRNPMLAEDLARALVAAAESDLRGLYHVAGGEVVTRLEFGRKVCRAFGFDEALLVPIRMEDFEYLARRPLDSTLNTAKFHSATGLEPTPIAEALAGLAGSM